MVMAIYSYLQGGLGNQMFQYAIARALSEHYNTAFILNRSWFDTPQNNATPRELQLSLLNIKDIRFTDEAFPKKLGKFGRYLQRFVPTKPLVIYQRNAFDFDPSLFKLKNTSTRDLYLSGYWQAFPYIDAIREQLKQEFRTKSEISDSYRAYLQQIHSSESVMIHIRRGDYVHSPAAAQYHGTLPIHYYKTAIQDLLALKPNAHFFIFSDDLKWAKEALGPSVQTTYIEHASSDDAAAQELQLMFACKHHIIANSSLSWWGAWLKQDSSGLVYAPNLWIRDANFDTSKLFPPKWKKVDC
jgi:hypothetical protein